jgi:hypothetical protein
VLPHALLVSRGTGSQGLNVQFANVVIRCGPWWKNAWEEQAAGRVHRPRQRKLTFVYELRAQDCAVGKNEMGVQDKNRVNTRILSAITRDGDGEPHQRGTPLLGLDQGED